VGRIPDEDVQRVRDATDVVSLISESVVLKKKGRLFWGLCPFHGEKTPSFKVDPGTQLWHCFGCGEGGDAFGYLMKTEHLDFPDSVRALADRASIEIREEGGEGVSRDRRERLVQACEEAARFYHRYLVGSRDAAAAAARDYLQGRGFGIDVAKRFTVGYAPGHGALCSHLAQAGFTAEEIVDANLGMRGERGLRDRFYERVMFPIHDLRGRTVGFGGRVLGDAEPKYLNTQETPIFHKSRNLYAIDVARNEMVVAKEAVVVEGYTDVIAMHEAGVKNAVATLGTALTSEHVKLLGRFAQRIVYLFDADAAGMRAADRAGDVSDLGLLPEVGEGYARSERFLSGRVELLVASVPEGKDPADLAAAGGEEALRAVIAGAVPFLRFAIDRRIEAEDLSSAEGRARAIDAAAAVLASVKGSLLAQDYAQYVAGRLTTDYVTVVAAMDRVQPAFGAQTTKRSEGSEGPTQTAAPRRRDPHYLAQREYVGLVARMPELRPKARSLLTEGLVPDEGLRALLAAIIDASGAVGTQLVSAVSAEDQGLASVLGEVVTQDDGEVDNEVAAVDLAHRLKEFSVERQIIQGKARLKELDAVKDGEAYDDEFRRVTALQKQLDRLRSGESDGEQEDG